MKFPDLTLPVLHFDEPQLEFGSQQTTAHPKDGLFLYGPLHKSKKTGEVRIGVNGTPAGINHFRLWAAQVKKLVSVPPPGKSEKKNRLHLANFPGMEETFKVSYNEADFVTYPLEPRAIDTATRILNLHEAVGKVVKLYTDRARRHIDNDERTVDVWVLVVPEIVFERCRPQAKRTGLPKEKGDFGKKQSKRSDLPLLSSIVDRESENIFDDVPDFHRQVKAEFLSISPTQIVRETTLDPEAFKNKSGYPTRRTQDRATVAWNLTTGLYYKTQPVPPWRLFGVRAGVCYVGLVYKNIRNDPNDHACCAAQMFLSEGDGVVFRGANGPWKTGDYEFHLKPDAAKDLIRKVLTTYAELHKGPPAELFIHGQASFNEEEWRAFEEAAPAETNVVGVRIRTTNGETKLFRDGDYPVLRGTALILDEKNAHLWTTGYVPQLDTYIGSETPNPLFITVLKSKKTLPEIKTVLNDIMGLTKINYNSCNFNDGLPVTVRFANMVGEVLTMGSAKGTERQPFKYYVRAMTVWSATRHSMRNEYAYTIAQCDVSPDNQAALESYRDKRRVWLSWIDADEHHAVWQVLSSMVWSDVSFKSLTHFAIDDENSALNNSLLAEALLSGHVAIQVLAIRRLMDDRSADIISVRRLVKDLRRNFQLLTRDNYVCFDGLPYDYEAVQREEIQRMVGKGIFWGETSGPGAHSTSRMAHEQFDRLAGVDPANRRREDQLPVSLLATIEQWIDNSDADELAQWSHAYLAHAGGPEARKRIAELKVTTGKITNAIKALARATEAV